MRSYSLFFLRALSARLGLLIAIVMTTYSLITSDAQAFILSNADFVPWRTTATGTRSEHGQPVTLTWSIVGDGTLTPGESTADPLVSSNLVSFLDGIFGGNPIGSNPNDLTRRPWFDEISQPFDRWEEISGINYVYEPNDDNLQLGGFAGQLGVRGDIRLSGRNIDGAGSTLAFNFLPTSSAAGGDMVIDTSEFAFYSNSSNNFRPLRNVVVHELGHGLNLEHVVSSTDGLLLEPVINNSFDGPQLDEVRAAHFFYGDFNEKSFSGLGNGVASRATNLGLLTLGSTTSVGTDANVPSQLISQTATDFVSISNIDDTDFFSFTIPAAGLLDAELTPLGGVFTQAPEGGFPTTFDANSRSDLSLSIFDSDQTTLLATVNNGGVGESDTLVDLNLLDAGQYYARVTGAADTIQLYQLDLTLSPLSFQEADFNEDFAVNELDLQILTTSLGNNSLGDADGDGDTDGADFLLWQRQFDGSVSASSALSVPEPTTVSLLLVGLSAMVQRRRHHVAKKT